MSKPKYEAGSRGVMKDGHTMFVEDIAYELNRLQTELAMKDDVADWLDRRLVISSSAKHDVGRKYEDDETMEMGYWKKLAEQEVSK